MFSLILPVYNVEKYLKQCVDSILTQTCQDFEVILVDDGSSDNSGKLCDQLSENDARLRVYHQPNRGVSAARNHGISEAKGDWILFIDPDDFLGADYLDNFNVIRNDADIIIQGMSFYDNKSGEIFKTISFQEVTLSEENTLSVVDDSNLLAYGGVNV